MASARTPSSTTTRRSRQPRAPHPSEGHWTFASASEREAIEGRRFQFLEAVAELLSGTTELDQILPELTADTARAIGADKLGIVVFTEDGEAVLLSHWCTTDALASEDASVDVVTGPRENPSERRMMAERRVLANDELAGVSSNFPEASLALAPCHTAATSMVRSGRAAWTDRTLIRMICGSWKPSVSRLASLSHAPV